MGRMFMICMRSLGKLWLMGSIDPDIEAKLNALEEEEERLEAEGFYDSDDEIVLPPFF
jgi:hypothetical protein